MRLAIPARLPKHPLTATLSWLLVTFLVLFPKGGFKVGPAPVTWGYILLALSTAPLLIFRLIAFPLRFAPRVYGAAGLILPFLAIFLVDAQVLGTSDPNIFIGELIVLVYLPFMFLFVFPPFLPRVNSTRFTRYLLFCILAAAVFGIVMFVYHPIVGSFIEIPYLTVNSADYGLIELKKHIARGTFLKLISTYNNGNLYGVATLILLPMYNVLEPRRWRRYTLVIALGLTLSRTVWAGLLINEVWSLLTGLRVAMRRFPRILPGPALKAVFSVAAVSGVVGVGLLLNQRGVDFLFDRQLGGRSVELLAFDHLTWIPQQPAGPFAEIVYASAAKTYGIFGLVAFVLLLVSPLLLFLAQRRCYGTPLQRAALRGLILYALLGLSDGALDLIPVLAFYWFTYMVFLYGWPGTQPDQNPSVRQTRPAHEAVGQPALAG